jgi:hypothetical protein
MVHRCFSTAIAPLTAAVLVLAACTHSDDSTTPSTGGGSPRSAGSTQAVAGPSQAADGSSDPGKSSPPDRKTPTAPGESGASRSTGAGGSGSSGNPAPAPTKTTGAVEVPAGSAADQCKITSARLVSRIFATEIQHETSGISGTDAQLCQFTVAKTNAGPGGVIEMSLHKGGSAATFTAVRKQNKGSVKVKGVGTAAFYLPKSATLQIRRGRTLIAVSADLRSPGARKAARDKVRSDLIKLGRAIANQS